MAKSEKLYKDSPSLKRDEESGKVGVEKPSKADGENMGTEGNAIPGSSGEMPVGPEHHKAELHSILKRHEEEQKSMHDRHEKDIKEHHERIEKSKAKE